MILLLRVILILLVIIGIFYLFQRKVSIGETVVQNRKLKFTTLLIIGGGLLLFCVMAITAAEYMTRI